MTDIDFIVTCEKCGRIKKYSTIGNARTARNKKQCASCGRARANLELWKDEDFRARRGKAATDRWHKHWEDPSNREKLGKATSERNIERWKDAEYRAFMFDLVKFNSTRGLCGSYKGYHFRSSFELKFMIEMLDDKGLPIISCENRNFGIRYEYDGKVRTYYPDFRIDNRIIEVKAKNMWEDPIVKAKAAAAIAWCLEREFTYEMVDPGCYSKSEVIDMHMAGIIKLESKKLLAAITQKLEAELQAFEEEKNP